MHECFPKQSGILTARMKKTKRQTKKVRREAGVWKEVKRARIRSPDGLSQPY